jgi:hypothetical protein
VLRSQITDSWASALSVRAMTALTASDSPDQSSPRVFLFEANFFRAERAAFGVELLNLGTVTGSYDALCCILRDKQREISVLGVFRERAWRRNRLTVDIIGAAGSLVFSATRRPRHRKCHSSLVSEAGDRSERTRDVVARFLRPSASMRNWRPTIRGTHDRATRVGRL